MDREEAAEVSVVEMEVAWEDLEDLEDRVAERVEEEADLGVGAAVVLVDLEDLVDWEEVEPQPPPSATSLRLALEHMFRQPVVWGWFLPR